MAQKGEKIFYRVFAKSLKRIHQIKRLTKDTKISHLATNHVGLIFDELFNFFFLLSAIGVVAADLAQKSIKIEHPGMNGQMSHSSRMNL